MLVNVFRNIDHLLVSNSYCTQKRDGSATFAAAHKNSDRLAPSAGTNLTANQETGAFETAGSRTEIKRRVIAPHRLVRAVRLDREFRGTLFAASRSAARYPWIVILGLDGDSADVARLAGL